MAGDGVDGGREDGEEGGGLGRSRRGRETWGKRVRQRGRGEMPWGSGLGKKVARVPPFLLLFTCSSWSSSRAGRAAGRWVRGGKAGGLGLVGSHGRGRELEREARYGDRVGVGVVARVRAWGGW